MNDIKIRQLGSVIKLRPEFEERYTILHKHTFPGVLRSICRANIRNYSIFLESGILFSYMEYIGDDYDADMAAMADETTREWWKLTDPMQEPLESRKEGEWWAGMEMLCHEDGDKPPNRQAGRLAYVCNEASLTPVRDTVVAALMNLGFQNLSVYRKCQKAYLYMEHVGEAEDVALRTEGEFLKLSRHGSFLRMKEIFHTPGTRGKKRVMVTG